MKKNRFFIFLALCLFFQQTHSQYQRASVWKKSMEDFAQQDAKSGIAKKTVLFVGSSSIKMWKSLKEDFPKSNVLNRGFGGSYMTDVIYFFDQVIKPYVPKQVVLYEGDNDLVSSAKTPQSFADDVVTITRMIHIYFPKTSIILVSIKPSPSRKQFFEKYRVANELMKSYAQAHKQITYVDIWEAMLNKDGSPNKSLYLKDMLHMNRKGYDIWKQLLEPHLIID